MSNVSPTELDIAVQNIDDTRNDKRSSYLERDLDYSRNNCLKGSPKLCKLRRKPPGSTSC